MFTIRFAGAIVAAFLLSGCSLQQWYPERFDTPTEVFAVPPVDDTFAQAPPASKLVATFPAPYFDVYSVAARSVTQNQWNLVAQDQASGTLLATRVVGDQFMTPNGPLPADRHYHYLLRVSEENADSTRVEVVAKTQGACIQANRGAMAALSVGISEAYTPSSMKHCRDEGSKTTWAMGETSTRSELNNLAILVRNNLIELGYE